MKKDEIYPYYIDYLNDRLNEGKISKGSLSLLKMSSSSLNAGSNQRATLTACTFLTREVTTAQSPLHGTSVLMCKFTR